MAWYYIQLSSQPANCQLGDSVSNVTQCVDAVFEAVGHPRESVVQLPRAWSRARDEVLETVHVFAHRLANAIQAISRESEGDWEQGGSGHPIPHLLAIHGQLRSLRHACHALRLVVLRRFAAANRHAHLASRSYAAAKDAVTLREIETDLGSTLWYLDRATRLLERATHTVGDAQATAEPPARELSAGSGR